MMQRHELAITVGVALELRDRGVDFLAAADGATGTVVWMQNPGDPRASRRRFVCTSHSRAELDRLIKPPAPKRGPTAPPTADITWPLVAAFAKA